MDCLMVMNESPVATRLNSFKSGSVDHSVKGIIKKHPAERRVSKECPALYFPSSFCIMS